MPTMDDVVSDLARLVRFNTISNLSNIALIDWAEDRFRPLGAECMRIPNADGTKENLWVRFGPEAPGGVVLSGHTDVVPVEGQDWHTDPFELVEQDGRLHGRGTSDMKCFIAFCAAYAPLLADTRLKRPVHVALSYDEEVGCTGAPAMIERISDSVMRPSVAWIGEPTNWHVVSGHKGNVVTRVEVTGHEAHSSQTHLGVSAIESAISVMAVLHNIAEELKSKAELSSMFEPPYPTLTVGQIRGGTASNILARKCEFVFDLRCIAGVDPDIVLEPFYEAVDTLNAEMSSSYAGTGIAVERLCNAPPLAVNLESEAEQFVRRITGDNARTAVAYTAEAGQFNEAAMPAVLCGPGSIDQAHRPNEYIEITELQKGLKIFDRFISTLTG